MAEAVCDGLIAEADRGIKGIAMDGRCWMSIGCLLLSGCVLESKYDRLAQAKQLQAAELEGLREDLAEQDQVLARQAAEELELRKRIAKLNEQLAALRETNRHLQDKADAADRADKASEGRLKTQRTNHDSELARLKASNDQMLAERDAHIRRLKEHVARLEGVLAKSAGQKKAPTTGPTP